MKRYTLYLPLLALIVLTTLWLRHAGVEHAALQAAIATQRGVNARDLADRAAVIAQKNTKALEENNAALQADLHRIEETTRQIESQTAALQLKLPPSLDAEVTESYGRISDMGTELGQYFRLNFGDSDEMQKELKRRGLNEESDLSEDIVRAFGKFTTWAPEIGAMEDTPAEIGSLQASALRATFSLDDTQTKDAEAIIEAHFSTMKAAGLTYASKDATDWRERRSESLTQLLWKLRPLIPTNSKQTGSLPQIVNLGAGIETTTLPPEPGTTETQTVQNFPNWPAVPWLRTKGDE
jgi:hypothetical protein